MMNTDGKDTGIENKSMQLSLADKWILSRLQKTIDQAHKALKDFRFDLYAHTIYDFTWNEFCDWYLELSKPILTSSDSSEEAQRGTRHTLAYTLETLLRLLHPIMPFITEIIWQRTAGLAGVTGKSIMLQAYPQIDNNLIDEQSESELEWLKSVIISIRTIRSEMNISPAKQLPILLRKGSKTDKANVEHLKSMLHTLAKVESISWLGNDEDLPPSASAFVGELEIYLPMAGFINLDEETARLKKEIGKLEKDLTVVSNKLSNASFVDRAPADVVEKEKARLSELTASISKLEQQLDQLSKIEVK
jgi:valyl-tRNA synthetase